VTGAWGDFDLAVHVPVSENCGGVVEPLLAGVPVVASKVGGLPEVVFDGRTGMLVDPEDPETLALKIEEALDDLPRCREMARRGSRLVATMFDVRRTAKEIAAIYEFLNMNGALPGEFDSRSFVENG
jgi:glycosyltransferase involved in cell wall biosynthesis